MKYWIITFGCQMNKSDSERIATILENAGYSSASDINEVDLLLVNMCSVRQSAVDRTYGLLSKFEKMKAVNEKLKTVLTGCILDKDKKKFLAKFDFVLNIKDLPKLPKFLQNSHNLIIDDRQLLETTDYFKIKPKSSFSAFAPITTGCNNFCSYCVVPFVRGRKISRPAEEIICEVKNLVKRGAKEIWLLGQNVNSYKCKKEQVPLAGEQNAKFKITNQNSKLINFPVLLKMVDDIPGKFWIRFTSSHPKDLSDELINTMVECKKVTEYLNLPVQAGDDKVLKRMKRPYTIAQYKNLVKKIRKKIPDITLSTDVIVGFPGETKKQFENTVRLFKEIKFDMAYIAKYSPRPKTTAFKMEDNVSQEEKSRREKVLTNILRETALENNKKYIGKEMEVLAEKNKKGFLLGKSRQYKTVKFEGSEDLLENFTTVKITDALPWGLKGEIKKTL